MDLSLCRCRRRPGRRELARSEACPPRLGGLLGLRLRYQFRTSSEAWDEIRIAEPIRQGESAFVDVREIALTFRGRWHGSCVCSNDRANSLIGGLALAGLEFGQAVETG